MIVKGLLVLPCVSFEEGRPRYETNSEEPWLIKSTFSALELFQNLLCLCGLLSVYKERRWILQDNSSCKE